MSSVREYASVAFSLLCIVADCPVTVRPSTDLRKQRYGMMASSRSNGLTNLYSACPCIVATNQWMTAWFRLDFTRGENRESGYNEEVDIVVFRHKCDESESFRFENVRLVPSHSFKPKDILLSFIKRVKWIRESRNIWETNWPVVNAVLDRYLAILIDLFVSSSLLL